MSYINIAHLKSGLTGKLVWASISPDFLYLLAFSCTITAVYAGREFRQRTICYEIMNGYDFCKIAFTKTVTCGVIMPAVMIVCLMAYLFLFPAALCEDFLLRIFCLFLLFSHICSCAVLYCLLCRSPVMGGAFAFIKFFVVEAGLLSGKVEGIRSLLVFEQWYRLLDIEAFLSKELVMSIIVSFVAEYGILQGILLWLSRRWDM